MVRHQVEIISVLNRRPGISVYLAEMVANMRAQIKTAGENCQIFGGRVEQKLEEFLKSL